MEIKAELLKPYSEDERCNFIVEQSHNLGYEIQETEESLQAWGYTLQEREEMERERIAGLSLTRGDVFDALIKARMIDESYVLGIIEEMPEETDEQKLTKMLSKNACQNALNFHRSHPMVDYIGEALNISSHNLDMFFDTNDYHYLLAETEGNN